MLDFFTSIIEFLTTSLLLIFNLVVWLFNLVIWLFCGIINTLVNIFPDSPFTFDFTFSNDLYLGYLNWLLPINIILNITFVWCSCMLLYWGYGVVMRWVKLID